MEGDSGRSAEIHLERIGAMRPESWVIVNIVSARTVKKAPGSRFSALVMRRMSGVIDLARKWARDRRHTRRLNGRSENEKKPAK